MKPLIIPKEDLVELKAYRKKPKYKSYHTKIQALILRAEGNHNLQQISESTGLSTTTISIATKKYLENGIAAIVTENRGDNHRSYMTYEGKETLLNDFIDRATLGQVITVKEMHDAYKKQIGKETTLSGFYYILHKHGWRKVAPRPKHPKKAGEAQIESSKKLTFTTEFQ